jgi:hypothetical protein
MSSSKILFSLKTKNHFSKEKSVDWYWVVGSFVFILLLLSFYLKDYFLASIVLIGGALFFITAKEAEEDYHFKITSSSILLKGEEFPFEEISSFWIFDEGVEAKKKILFTLKRSLFPHLSVHIRGVDTEEIRPILRKHILEKKQLPTVSELLSEWIGF